MSGGRPLLHSSGRAELLHQRREWGIWPQRAAVLVEGELVRLEVTESGSAAIFGV